jgi:hypothetical protein
MFSACREVTKLNLDSDVSLQVKLLGPNLQHSDPHESREINLNISREV